jgi:hypothetical protein
MRRNFLLAKLVILSLVLAFTAPPRAEAEQGTIKVNWRFAGTVINSVEVSLPPFVPTKPNVLINVQAVGSPGKAVIRALGSSADLPPGSCLQGHGLVFELERNDLVATFSDLSLLAAALDNGSICVNISTGEITGGPIHLVVTGGTGRFAGATGNLTIQDFVIRPVSPLASLAFETGEIVGTIQVP